MIRSPVRRSIISLNFVSIARGARVAEFLLSANQQRLSYRVAEQGTASVIEANFTENFLQRVQFPIARPESCVKRYTRGFSNAIRCDTATNAD